MWCDFLNLFYQIILTSVAIRQSANMSSKLNIAGFGEEVSNIEYKGVSM